MNPLTHIKVALDLFKDKGLSKDDLDLLVVGSIAPDVCDFGITQEKRTHKQGLQFLKYLNGQYYYFGVGVIIHGEDPPCLDWYAHSKQGYIESKRSEIHKIIRKYRKSLGGIDETEAVHHITEFCFDHLIAQENPELAARLHQSVYNPLIGGALISFANFFDVDKKSLRTMQSIVRSKHLYKYFTNFSTLEGTAHNFQKFLFYKSIRDRQSGNRIIKKLKGITKSSFSLIKTKLRDRSLTTLFRRCTEIIRKDHQEFLSFAEKNIKKTIINYKLAK